MKEKIINLIKKYIRELIILLLLVTLVRYVYNGISIWIKKPLINTVKKERPVYDYSFSTEVNECMYNSFICDPDERFYNCVGNIK